MAADYIKDLKTRAINPDGTQKKGSRELTAYLGLRAVLDQTVRNNPLDLRFSLGTKDGVRLGGIYRSHIGRLRVFWIASSQQRIAIVLFIGFRKDGDRRDAYALFERYLRAGEFDHHFEELGQANPLKK